MRRVASLIGVALSLAGLALLVTTHQAKVWAYLLISALAVAGLVDAYVIGRRIHSGQDHRRT